MTNSEIVNSFIQAINDHDVDKIYNLMSDDHIFVDGYGDKHVGKTGMKEGWQQYYKMFPDYKVEIKDVTENESIIGLLDMQVLPIKTLKMNETAITGKPLQPGKPSLKTKR